jgi:hypothetical protein
LNFVFFVMDPVAGAAPPGAVSVEVLKEGAAVLFGETA